ncbi:hypothetical protein BI081_gp148 [Mycobacterium phage Tonenili]|uniref:Uncharacterized protein n=1 Tax=Mycobacterium phage Tonenili TaxID=1891703 RepID=A0A1C9EHI6_9CAUD|nr:hypothetical protein BI081_gp148 [Mycobacterium phage Tonenili]AON96959.1 hypothetical protein SEA_TONENILI_239 [Mycobacterium phage Tonenili]
MGGLPSHDPAKDGPYKTSKRRRQIMKRIYQYMEEWRAQQEDNGMEPFLTTVDGEVVYYYDLMVGIDTLPPRQRQAFELICLQSYPESKACEIMLPNSQWSAIVQQYSYDGLIKMIAAYDAVQDGTWDPQAARKRRRSPTRKKRDVTTVENPEVPDDSVEQPATAPQSGPRHWDWTTWSEDHESLANYITRHGVDISPAQVKAVSFLRKAWYEDPEQVEERKRRREERKREREKFANETPEQRKARHLAARKLKSAQLAEQRYKELQDEVRSLREQAGLDPETGEPVAQ